MRNIVKIITAIVLLNGALTSCCPPQAKLQQAILTHLSNAKTSANKFTKIEDIRILNVKKYSCDSVEVYARVSGITLAKGASGQQASQKFDGAIRFTITRHGEVYVVDAESSEE